ncbi:MAG: NADH-quinone oxidoreductase subunit L [Prevotellaceae bacterium]|jgi:NADH-quinone oxidoreductase subunit L|nr:NADH-quinone oxidoreductase subunit L [Prevotellaceae bacterium]
MLHTSLILITPLILFIVLGLFGKYLSPKAAGWLGTAGLLLITCLAYITAYHYFFEVGKVDGVYQKMELFSFSWLHLGEWLVVNLGFMLDPIAAMMLVVITTVSLMVHIYSSSYMKGEVGFQRYYALLSLFTFSMLGLVVANNIFQMYIFWELVGVSSYSLIGFYYTKPAAVTASKKAFIVTRFADLGFLIGILILSYYTRTFDFISLTDPKGALISNPASATFMGASVFTWAMALIFMGGAGKSAMLPLHIWLPDAMEGPTPVSALIHAATMVVAGVYLVARLFPVYYFVTPEVLTGIAYIGAATSLFAAIVACTQTDIKRVLAFSTISQIAYMLVALGVSKYEGHDGLGYMASMFHLFTHAFFKALLFLGAGAVIHAVHSNEMKDMGSLRKYMPVTHITFLIACLAIAGIPPFSGFFSKDEIMVAALHSNVAVFVCQYIVAGLTAFYMFRLYYNIFWSKDAHYHHTPHEAPAAMSFPLIFLAALTVAVGFIPFSTFTTADGAAFAGHIDWSVAAPSIAVALVGIGIATLMYKSESGKADKVASRFGKFYNWAVHKFYFDELYLFITKNLIFKYISTPVAWFDRNVVDGFMNFQATLTYTVSNGIKELQSGNIQRYVWVFAMGALTTLALVLFVL